MWTGLVSGQNHVDGSGHMTEPCGRVWSQDRTMWTGLGSGQNHVDGSELRTEPCGRNHVDRVWSHDRTMWTGLGSGQNHVDRVWSHDRTMWRGLGSGQNHVDRTTWRLGLDDLATSIYHAFVALCYLTPILGAIVADSWLGKFKTIVYLSVVYTVGQVVMAISAIHDITDTNYDGIPDNMTVHVSLSMVGLLLIALGTGGIKPCVAAFGGDQFEDHQCLFSNTVTV
ncbi:hypothetical protein CRUP_019988 [Coryphaenoides rupestris]|nr:hypothetical protein CRUP_019988 [Coryphaenoides rupestris]